MNIYLIIAIGYLIICVLCLFLTKSFRDLIRNDMILSSWQEFDGWKKLGLIILYPTYAVIILLFLPFLPYCYIRDKFRPPSQPELEKQRLNEYDKYRKTHYCEKICFLDKKYDNDFLLDEIIYIEPVYNASVNQYIISHYETLQRGFRSVNYNFIYLPKKDITRDVVKQISFYNYAIKADSSSDYTKKLYEHLISIIGTSQVNGPATILKARGKYDDCVKLYIVPVDLENIELSFRWHIQGCYLPRTRYRKQGFNIENIGNDDYADECFNVEAQRLMDEIVERINRLQLLGYKKLVLDSIIPKHILASPQVSRLHITKDFRIFLTDYDNTEITMTPLPKAVFILFLKHPEGILFKELPQYRGELLEIYKRITNRENIQDIVESIELVTNPQRNSINEKCSRIREAFIAHFDESLMKPYFITGERGQTKKIALDRAFVTWELE